MVPRAAVLLSTYNQPEWLRKALWGYQAQDLHDFELLIADDGSTGATREVVEELRASSPFEIRHLWQEDRGFRKCAILNRAIAAAAADYLVFSDGDCIPRRDFVSTHLRLAETGRFLSGGYFKLPLELSRAIARADVFSGDFASPAWLVARGVPRDLKLLKLGAHGRLARLLGRLTPTKRTWNGHNSSGWRADLLRVGGLDERMGYWAEDRELGERLVHAGLRPKQIRYATTCVHLDHERPWRDPEVRRQNLEIRRETRRQRRAFTPYGIPRGAASPAPPPPRAAAPEPHAPPAP